MCHFQINTCCNSEHMIYNWSRESYTLSFLYQKSKNRSWHHSNFTFSHLSLSFSRNRCYELFSIIMLYRAGTCEFESDLTIWFSYKIYRIIWSIEIIYPQLYLYLIHSSTKYDFTGFYICEWFVIFSNLALLNFSEFHAPPHVRTTHVSSKA